MKALAARLARGEEAAFAELYDACANRLHSYLAARLGSRDRAAEVVQEAFLRAVAGRKRFARVENPIAYLFQIARNEAVRISARERRQAAASSTAVELFESNSSDASREQAELVSVALIRLEPDDREFVELKLFAGLTFREIADITKLPPATVATRYRRALEALRPWLTKQLS